MLTVAFQNPDPKQNKLRQKGRNKKDESKERLLNGRMTKKLSNKRRQIKTKKAKTKERMLNGRMTKKGESKKSKNTKTKKGRQKQ